MLHLSNIILQLPLKPPPFGSQIYPWKCAAAQSLQDNLKQHGKNGSMENILSPQEEGSGFSISKVNFIIGIRREYSIRDPALEEIAEHYYDSFTDERVRCCEMLCTYQSITFRKVIVSNPKKIMLHFCACCSKDLVSIDVDTLHSIVNIGGSSLELYEEQEQSDALVQAHLKLIRWIEICCEHDRGDENQSSQNKNMRKLIQLSTVSEILDLAPSLIIKFRDNVLNQLSNEHKIELVSEKEEIAFSGARACVQQIMVRRSVRVWRQFLHETFISWERYTKASIHKRCLEYRMRYWKAKRMLKMWYKMHRRTLNYDPTDTLVRYKKRKYLLLWHHIARILKNYSLHPNRCKNIALATGMVNMVRKRFTARMMLLRWWEEVVVIRRICQARIWSLNFSLRTYFKLWQKIIDNERLQQNRKDHRLLIYEELAQIKSARDNANEETVEVAVATNNCEPKENDSQSVLNLRDSYNSSVNSIILRMQKKNRIARYEQQKREFQLTWERKWEEEEKRRVDNVSKKMTSWMNSREGRERILKQIKMIERQLQNPDLSPSSPASIVLSLLDSKMGHAGVLSDEFFQDLERIATGTESVITTDEFQKIIKQKQLDLDPKDVRAIFDGFGKESNKTMTVRTLKREMIGIRDWSSNGVEGCQWKMYVDPANQYIVYHNVIQRRKIMDHRLHRKNLKDIAKDQLLFKGITSERRRIHCEKKIDLENSMQVKAVEALERFWMTRKHIEKTHRRLRIVKMKTTPQK